MKNSIFLLIFALAMLMASCGSTRECKCKKEEISFVIQDTICIPGQHIHLPDEQKCSWALDEEIVVVDTLTFEMIIPNKCQKKCLKTKHQTKY
jgi:hypothetical protein